MKKKLKKLKRFFKNNKKEFKNVCILSGIVLLFGFLSWLALLFGEDLIINNFVIFSFQLINFRISIIIVVIDLLLLLWFIYGIFVISKKYKNKAKRKFVLSYSLFIIIVLDFLLLFLLVSKNLNTVRYDYKIQYYSESSVYNIYKTKNNIEMLVDEQVLCGSIPCSSIISNKKISFSSENMKIINNFIEKLFDHTDKKSIELSIDDLVEEQKNILNSIINNDESWLDVEVDDSNCIVIVTDMKYQTMLDDGGSNYNVYYKIDLDNKSIVKYEDHYVGFRGYEYKDKVIYSKFLSDDVFNEINTLIDNILLGEDINDSNNYQPYVIKNSDIFKEIYNLNSINNLKNMLSKIDNLNE